jgi:ATP-dependent Clp protease ATP-binding subunit ClpA
VVLAQEEARMLGHVYVGTEHILLGLIHEGDGVAAKALESLDISLEVARQQVERTIGRGSATLTGHIPFTPSAKKVLELSFREALQLGHNHIDTEHVLLGLIRKGKGVAAQVLQKLGVDLDRVRQAVIQRLPGDAVGMSGKMPTMEWVPPEFRRALSPFRDREKIVLSLLMHEGMTTTEIADLLGVSKEKVGEIVQAVVEKLTDV